MEQEYGNGMFIQFVVAVVVYVFMAWVCSRIGGKFGVGSFLEFLIPIWNIVLLLRCAGMSGIHVIWYIIPIVNMVVNWIVWTKISTRLGKNQVLYLIMIIFIPIVPMLILAFDSSMPVVEEYEY